MGEECKILVVESEQQHFVQIHQLLEPLGGYQVDFANKEALYKVRELNTNQAYDLIILDQDLTNKPGSQSISYMLKVLSEIPVIILTSNDEEQNIYEIINSGAQDYFLKDRLNIKKLIRKIAFSIERHRDSMTARNQSNLSIALNSANTLNQAFQAILKFGISLKEFQAGGIYYLNNDTKCFHLYTHKGISDAFYKKVEILSHKSVLGGLMIEGKPVYKENQENEIGNFGTGVSEGLRNLVILPLKDGQQLIGCLALSSRRFKTISNKLKHLLEVTLVQTGSVIHKIRADEQLIESKRNFQDLVEKTEVAICIDDKHGRIKYGNQAFYDVFGYQPDELQIMSHNLLVHPEDLHAVESNHNKRYQGKDAANRYEARGIRKDGKIIHLEFVLSNIIQKDGKVVGSRTYILDITRRKRYEEALEYSESFNRRLMENTPIGLIHTNASGVVTYENKALRELLDLIDEPDRSLVGHDIHSLLYESTTESAELISRLRSGEPIQGEIVYFKTHKDQILILSVYATALHNHQNNYDGAILMVNDITQKQKADQALKISEEKYRTLFERSTDPILILKNNHFVDCNQAALDILKIDSKDQTTKIHPSEVSPEFQPDGSRSEEKAEEMMAIALENGFHRFEWVHKDFEGNDFWVDISLTSIPSGDNPGLYTVWRNINDKKLAEKALKDSEEKYRIIFETSPVGIVVTDFNGNIIDYNESIIDRSGYTKEEFLKLKAEDMYYDPSERAHVMQEIMTKGAIKNFELRYKTKSGDPIVTILSSSKYMYGKTPALLTVISDINDRVKGMVTKEIIQNISTAVNTTETIYQLYEVIQHELGKIVDATNFTIGFYDKEANELHFPYMQDEKKSLTNAPASHTISSLVFESNKSKLFNTDELNELRKQGRIFNYGGKAKSWLGVPFGTGEKAEGILIVQDYKKANAFSTEDQQLLEIIANQVAISINQKRNEDLIRRLSRSVEQSPASVIITSLKGEIEYVNKKFTEITGYDSEEVIGKNPNILQSGETATEIFQNAWENLKHGKEWRGTFINKRKNGDTYYDEAWIAPLTDSQGKPTHYLSIQEDITERRRTEKELIEAKNRAVESDRIKSSFLATMSHELRTPLNAVIGFSELIPETIDREEIDDYSGLINESGQHLLSIIEDIFDITVLESGKIEITPERINMAEFMIEMEQILTKEMKFQGKSDIEIKINNTLDQHLHFDCDKHKLRKVFTHLIKNAVKFTQRGLIELGCEQQHSNIRFYIKDTGIGIPKNKQQVIFDVFRQVDETHTREYGGTGVGLAISSKMMEHLGGNIYVESTPGTGSVFYFNVPCSSFETQSTEVMKKDYPNLSGKNILIAEDEQTNYLYLEALLMKTKANVLWAENGKDAIDLFENNDVDLILMDLKMPEMNGYDATKIIRERSSEAIIIAQTAFALPGDKQKAMDIGFNDYITKPISSMTLLKILSKHIA